MMEPAISENSVYLHQISKCRKARQSERWTTRGNLGIGEFFQRESMKQTIEGETMSMAGRSVKARCGSQVPVEKGRRAAFDASEYTTFKNRVAGE